MAVTGLHAIVGPLFVPANRPDRFAKAAACGADAVILDLEDAVPADGKAQARANLRGLALDIPVIVRINGHGTPWFDDDLAAVATLPIAAIMLPKAQPTGLIACLRAFSPVIALIECARGLAQARAIAATDCVERLAFGSIDYAADLGCDLEAGPVTAARSEIVLASRLAGLPAPWDGVTTDIARPDAARQAARLSRAGGFGGKLLIHPNQVQPVRDGFRPGEGEIAWARRVLDGADGAVRIDGAMVDEPVRARARAILDRC